MGFSFNSFCKLSLGIGLGILAVSCLVVTVCFGAAADKVSDLTLIESQLTFDNYYSCYQCSVAIAVLGCISAVAAIGAIVFTIILEEQTLILIIVGGVSALFAFGCIVAEGVYTLQYEKYLTHNKITREDNFREYSHKNAQKYIKKAIEELYNQGIDNLKGVYELNNLPSWDSVTNKLGKNIDGRIFTYSDIWSESSNEYAITLQAKEGVIYAQYDGSEIPVASLCFYIKGSFQEKQRICWFNKDMTDIKCKNVNGEKIKNCEIEYRLDSDYFQNEMIVEGTYYSEADVEKSDEIRSANYLVSGFPFAYYLITFDELKEIQKQMEDGGGEEDCKHSPASFKDSSRKFKVSGKRYAKALLNYDKEDYAIDNSYFYLAHKEVKDKNEYDVKCSEYKEEQMHKEDKDDYYNIVCNDYRTSIDTVYNYLQNKYDDKNRGKVIPAVKKFYMKESKKDVKDAYLNSNSLYATALINLIIQIFGIIFWACGKFLGGGGGDAKTPSDGEA